MVKRHIEGDPHGLDVMRGLSEEVPALQGGHQTRGKLLRIGIRPEQPAVPHPPQAGGQQPFPFRERLGERGAGLVVLVGELVGQRTRPRNDFKR